MGQGEVGGEGAAVRGSRVQAEGNPPHGQAQKKRNKSARCSCKLFLLTGGSLFLSEERKFIFEGCGAPTG